MQFLVGRILGEDRDLRKFGVQGVKLEVKVGEESGTRRDTSVSDLSLPALSRLWQISAPVNAASRHPPSQRRIGDSNVRAMPVCYTRGRWMGWVGLGLKTAGSKQSKCY